MSEGKKHDAGRGGVLTEALSVINGERQDTYGNPEDSHARIAAYWAAYLGPRLTTHLDNHDAAVMLCLLKLARMSGQPYHRDNYRDAAGYIGLACDMAAEKAGKPIRVLSTASNDDPEPAPTLVESCISLDDAPKSAPNMVRCEDCVRASGCEELVVWPINCPRFRPIGAPKMVRCDDCADLPAKCPGRYLGEYGPCSLFRPKHTVAESVLDDFHAMNICPDAERMFGGREKDGEPTWGMHRHKAWADTGCAEAGLIKEQA